MNESPVFFGEDANQLFGIIHEPEHVDINKAIIICHSFAEEKLWSHRVLVSYARILADMGYLVFRFDYHGYGDSDGEFLTCSIDSYAQDISIAIKYLRSKYQGLSEIGLLGHRLGASIILSKYSTLKAGGPLILWDPIIDGDRFIQEFLRSHLTTQLAVYGEVKETRDVLIEKMQQGGVINIEGYDLNYSQFKSIKDMTLAKEYTELPSVLIVQVGRNVKPKKEYEDLAIKSNGELKCVVEDPFWREIKKFYSKAPNLYATTTDWIQTSS